MGSKEAFLIQQSKRMRKPIPDRILNKPKLQTGMMLYLDAFWELIPDANENKQIPWSIIIKYCEFYDFSLVQTERLVYFIRRLSNVYSKWENSKGG